MNDKPKRWLPQFTMRTILVLVALAALAAWWARGEMLAEQRRHELIEKWNAGESNSMGLEEFKNAPWRRRLGAWLLGRPVAGRVRFVSLPENILGDDLRELFITFPDARFNLTLDRRENVDSVLDVLADSKSTIDLRILATIEPTDDLVRRLARLDALDGIGFTVACVDDDLLRRVADAGINVEWIDEASGLFSTHWQSVTNEGLRHAATFRNFRLLSAGPKASDAGVEAFRDHQCITGAYLTGPSYTDASADVLASLPQLKSIGFDDTTLSDAAMAKAIRGKSIEQLSLCNVTLGEETIAAMGGLTSLGIVMLDDVELSPELAAAITKPPVRQFILRGDYSDADVQRLTPAAPTLTSLTLVTPNVTDQGLAWLSTAGKLNRIVLFGTRITKEGIKSLKSTGQRTVTVVHSDHDPPPFTPQDVEEIKSATGGLVEVTLKAIPHEEFLRELPQSTREAISPSP